MELQFTQDINPLITLSSTSELVAPGRLPRKPSHSLYKMADQGVQKQIRTVKEFLDVFGSPTKDVPTADIGKDKMEWCHKLMREENDEYLEACEKGDVVEIADALGDQLYVLCGTILKHGMHNIIGEVFDEIHRSNMTKVGDDGKPVYRTDGKIAKGPNYKPPQLKQIVEDAINKSEKDQA